MSVPLHTPEEFAWDDEDRLAEALAQRLGAQLRHAVAERGRALVAVSGGRTPRKLFAALRRQDLPWPAVTISLADERWVDESHADSNAALVRAHLLGGDAAAARFVPLFNGAATPEAGRAECESRLRTLPLPFDALVLGMGDDGHTASLFPDCEELTQALDRREGRLCCAIRPRHAPHARMSLTLHALLQARLTVLQFAGARKLAIYRQACAARIYPVSELLWQNERPVEVWFSR